MSYTEKRSQEVIIDFLIQPITEYKQKPFT